MEKSEFIEAMAACVDSYTPADHIREQTSNIDLIAAMGPSGAGKNTLIREASIHKVVSEASRNPRLTAGETEGEPYHFLHAAEYPDVVASAQSGEHVQIALYNNEYYGSRITAYPTEGIAAIDVVFRQFRAFEKAALFRTISGIYIVPESYDVLKSRRDSRSTLSEKELQARNEADATFIEQALEADDVLFMVNSDLAAATREFADIVYSGNSTESRQRSARMVAGRVLQDMQLALGG